MSAVELITHFDPHSVLGVTHRQGTAITCEAGATLENLERLRETGSELLANGDGPFLKGHINELLYRDITRAWARTFPKRRPV
jgi:hypothetical protein